VPRSDRAREEHEHARRHAERRREQRATVAVAHREGIERHRAVDDAEPADGAYVGLLLSTREAERIPVEDVEVDLLRIQDRRPGGVRDDVAAMVLHAEDTSDQRAPVGIGAGGLRTDGQARIGRPAQRGDQPAIEVRVRGQGSCGRGPGAAARERRERDDEGDEGDSGCGSHGPRLQRQAVMLVRDPPARRQTRRCRGSAPPSRRTSWGGR
jgi:hypothetical protein